VFWVVHKQNLYLIAKASIIKRSGKEGDSCELSLVVPEDIKSLEIEYCGLEIFLKNISTENGDITPMTFVQGFMCEKVRFKQKHFCIFDV